MLSNERLLLFNTKWDWEQDRQPKKNIRIHSLMDVGPLYEYRDDAPMVPGPTRVWQFKIRENVIDDAMARVPFKFSNVLPIKEVCKLGLLDRETTVALREAVAQRVAAKTRDALEGSGGQRGSRGQWGATGGGGGSTGGARGRYAD